MIKEKESQEENPQFSGNNQLFNYSIGKHSYVSYNSIVYHCDIGNYCSIGPNVVIGFGDHPSNELSTSPAMYYNELFFSSSEIQEKQKSHFEKVNIQHDVWIGANVFIKNGVKIGNGAIIGAGAVVLQDVNDYEIVVGVPAKVLKKRFSDEVITLLLELKWWNLEENQLHELKDIIQNPSKESIQAYLNK